MAAGRKAFVIQLEPHGSGVAPPVLRGWVEELESGLSAPFDSAAALVALLERALGPGAQGEDNGQ